MSEPIHVWAFYDAPQEFRDLSENGGDEDWLAVVPASMRGTYINWLDYGPFGVSSIDKHELADGRVVFIGTHA